LSRNPYAPPDAQVSDPSLSERSHAERPRTVAIAIWLMWASVILSVMNVPLSWETITASAGDSPQMRGFVSTFVIVVLALSFALYALLIWKMGQGRNWARIVMLILQLLSLLTNPFAQMKEAGLLAMAIGIASYVLAAVAVVLVFIPASREWFRPRKA
jgi:hypothetical protein